MRRGLFGLLALTLSVAASAPAEASTLIREGGTLLTFTAAPGVANDVTITYDSKHPATLTISTANDPVQTPLPANCSDPDQDPPVTTVSCTNVSRINAYLGDLDDKSTASATGFVYMTVSGGDGNDALTAAAGYQRLHGDAGDDTISGGDGYDELYGGPGTDVMDVGPGNGYATGDQGDDTIVGRDGDDNLHGGQGADTLSAGAGPDHVSGGSGVDTVRGEDGDDQVSGGEDDNAVDTVEGGAGNDVLVGQPVSTFDGGAGTDVLRLMETYAGDDYLEQPATVDLAAGTASSSAGQGVVRLVEDVAGGETEGIGYTYPYVYAALTLLGTAEANAIFGGAGPDTINPREGADFVNGAGGDDTIDTVDGHQDRVICADGVDTATVDAYDTHQDCENVTVRDARSVYDTPEDAAPKVAITSPSSSAVLSTTAPNTITADATDDKGIKHVVFSTGERTLCTDATAPYSCAYVPTSADVGRDTLVAIAVDTADQSASAVRTVSVPRFTATALTAATTPKRDAKAPYAFTTKGRLTLPAGVAGAAGCKGRVTVSFKAGKKTISTRRVTLKSDCAYSSKVTFRLPRRLNPKTLSVVTVFSGNDVLDPKTAARHTVRPR